MDWTAGPPFISLQLDAALMHVCTGLNLGLWLLLHDAHRLQRSAGRKRQAFAALGSLSTMNMMLTAAGPSCAATFVGDYLNQWIVTGSTRSSRIPSLNGK